MPLALTGEEAMETRCCGPAHAGRVGNDNERYCIVSACMAWRWIPQASMDNPERLLGGGIQKVEYKIGFCGLAGAP